MDPMIDSMGYQSHKFNNWGCLWRKDSKYFHKVDSFATLRMERQHELYQTLLNKFSKNKCKANQSVGATRKQEAKCQICNKNTHMGNE